MHSNSALLSFKNFFRDITIDIRVFKIKSKEGILEDYLPLPRINGLFIRDYYNPTVKYFFTTKTKELIEDLIKEIEMNSNAWDKQSSLAYFSELNSLLTNTLSEFEFLPNEDNYEFHGSNYIDCDKQKVYEIGKSLLLPQWTITFKLLYELHVLLMDYSDYSEIDRKKLKSPAGNKKLNWTSKLNGLVLIFLELQEQGFISNKPEDLKDFLINNFTYKDEVLSETTILTYLDPNKRDEKFRTVNTKDYFI